MNKNSESRFNLTPNIRRSRSMSRQPSSLKTTMNAGLLYPLYVQEVYPGDDMKQNFSNILRGMTPLYPVMDNAYIDIFSFFVPNRLVWEHWEQFITGGSEPDDWTTPTEYVVPQITIRSTAATTVTNALIDTPLDYMGYGMSVEALTQGQQLAPFNALYPRAYVKIWNDWFRDENLQTSAHLYTDDTDRVFSFTNTLSPNVAKSNYVQFAEYGMALCPVGKFKDYFTSALPQPQKGGTVFLPLSGAAPVTGSVNGIGHVYNESGSSAQPFTPVWRFADGTSNDTNQTIVKNGSVGTGGVNGASSISNPLYLQLAVDSSDFSLSGSADLSTASAATINQLRLAFQTQRYQEQLARCGSRYQEFLQGMFGVFSSDARLQRAEFLGAKRFPITQHQVAQTAPEGEDIGLGATGAFVFGSNSGHVTRKAWNEHGLYFVVACIRTDQTYSQGIPVEMRRRNRFDYYLPTFSHIGEQPIMQREIFNAPFTIGNQPTESVFGYKEAWAELRFRENRCSGYMRPQFAQSLAAWHYGNNFENAPTLNDSFIKQGVENIDRTLAVTTRTGQHQFFGDFYFDTILTRVMPLYSVPGLIDHN